MTQRLNVCEIQIQLENLNGEKESDTAKKEQK